MESLFITVIVKLIHDLRKAQHLRKHLGLFEIRGSLFQNTMYFRSTRFWWPFTGMVRTAYSSANETEFGGDRPDFGRLVMFYFSSTSVAKLRGVPKLGTEEGTCIY